MKTPWLPASLALLLPMVATAADDPGSAWRFSDNWPTHYVFADGTDLGLTLKYQYDIDRFSDDGSRLADAQTNRRRELGFYLKKKGVYDVTAIYDYQSKTWQDTWLRVQGRALVGRDVGALRVGYTKTPVGFEGNTSTGATTFLENSLPTQAVYASRRIGIDWALERPHAVLNAGYYSGGDLNGDNDGRMLGARAAWVPLHGPGHVLHLGLSASRESPAGSTDGRGIHTPPQARLGARAEASLLPSRVLDSGTLAFADRIDRRGVEALWIDGPWSAQGEYLSSRVSFSNGRPDYRGHGYYAFVSWVATGESRPYSAGNVGNLKPKGRYGALEFALRYSELDLDDRGVPGGRERNWTLGANWYLNSYLKLQANYVHVQSERRGLELDPQVFEVRAQLQF